MSNLRKLTKKDGDFPKGDVEAPRGEDASDRGAALRRGGHSPLFLAKVIGAKVVSLLIGADDAGLPAGVAGIIELMKDVLVGIVIGFFAICFLVLLDHANVIHVQGAHNFRDTAFALLNDPETLATIEESAELKFMTESVYAARRKEIDGAAARIADATAALERRTKESEEKMEGAEALRAEHDRLFAELGLDKFCGGCTWGNKMTCDQRVLYLSDTYNNRPIEARIGAMSRPACVSN